jgi:hypothetical protein
MFHSTILFAQLTFYLKDLCTIRRGLRYPMAVLIELALKGSDDGALF